MIIGVTGANGFIGKHLCARLKQIGHTVIEVDLPRGNIKNANSLEELLTAEVIIHLAVLPLANCNLDYHSCIETNITGTANVMTVARDGKAKRVILASASSVYGDPQGTPVGESHPTNPLTLYGMSKLAAEHVVKIMSSNFKLTHCIFRFTNVYGPGQQNGVIPIVINKILNDEIIEIVGSGDQTRDFIYVDDVIDHLVGAIDTPIYSMTMNLGSETQTSILDVVSKCAGYLNIAAKMRHIQAESDRTRFIANTSKLRSIFCKFGITDFDDGLETTIEWWKNGSETKTA